MEDLAGKILIGIIIAAVSSLITVHLSLARFRSEKWWERKIEAYTKVIEAFHHVKSFSDKHLNAEIRGTELPNETDMEVRALSREAHKEIDKYTDIGSFIFSDEFYNKLKEYQKELGTVSSNSNGWVDYLINDQELTDRYLKELIQLAKTDLRKKPDYFVLIVKAYRICCSFVMYWWRYFFRRT